MTEKKFYVPGIIIPAVGILLNLFVGSIVIGLLVAVLAFVLNFRKRNTHRTAIGIALSILSLLGVLGVVGIMIHDFSMYGAFYEQEGTLTDHIMYYLFW